MGSSHVGLLGEFDFPDSFSLDHHVLILDSHDAAAPGPSETVVVVEASSEVFG